MKDYRMPMSRFSVQGNLQVAFKGVCKAFGEDHNRVLESLLASYIEKHDVNEAIRLKREIVEQEKRELMDLEASANELHLQQKAVTQKQNAAINSVERDVATMVADIIGGRSDPTNRTIKYWAQSASEKYHVPADEIEIIAHAAFQEQGITLRDD